MKEKITENWNISGKKLCEYIYQKRDHHEKMIELSSSRVNEREHIGSLTVYNNIIADFHLQVILFGNDPYICRCELCEDFRNRDKLINLNNASSS